MTKLLVAILIMTNFVFHPCTGGMPGGKCQWCKSEEGIAVPEHIDRIGYDRDYVVTTQYLPIVEITNATIVDSKPFNYVSAPVLNDTLMSISQP